MTEIVGKLRVDFDVIQSTTKTLWIGDNSEWVYAETLPAYIYITLPGSRKKLEFLFEKKQINCFNSVNLGLSCLTGDCSQEEHIELKDGLYTLILKSSYTDFEKTKYYLKTDSIELELAKKIVENATEYSKSNKHFIEAVYDIDWLIKVAKAYSITGDFTKAEYFYKESKKLINKLI